MEEIDGDSDIPARSSKKKPSKKQLKTEVSDPAGRRPRLWTRS